MEDANENDHKLPLIDRSVKEWRRIKTDEMEFAKKRADELSIKAKELKKRSVRKNLQKFYKHQSDLVDGFLTIDTLHDEEKEVNEEDLKEEKTKKFRAKIAIYASFATNIVLFCLKMYAAISSRSLAVVASALDSFLDLLSGSIIFITSYFIKKENPYLYPIVFASCMFVATLQLLIQAIQELVGKPIKSALNPLTIAIICFTVVAKLSLYLFCRLQRSSPSALALAQDHRNDVLSNTFGVTTALLGFYLLWWIDPAGSIVMSLYIMGNWFRTGFIQIRNLTGKSATPDFLQQLTYLALNHDPRILKIDTGFYILLFITQKVRAFYLGTGFMAEVDIVLPRDMSLKDAHDIGEALQQKLERVAEVERGFVHLDYEYDHSPEHQEGKKLVQLLKD